MNQEPIKLETQGSCVWAIAGRLLCPVWNSASVPGRSLRWWDQWRGKIHLDEEHCRTACFAGGDGTAVRKGYGTAEPQ